MTHEKERLTQMEGNHVMMSFYETETICEKKSVLGIERVRGLVIHKK